MCQGSCGVPVSVVAKATGYLLGTTAVLAALEQYLAR
jgi:hypothetical protein